jgi:TRAP-type mannitol/chloroaromatic compound transport system permease small subunit
MQNKGQSRNASMKPFIAFAHGIDWINDQFGQLAKWAVILSCLISCANAVVRYTFSVSSNGWLEVQWYLFAGCVMLGASQVLRVNEHVRVDVFYGQLTGRRKVYVDLFGLVFFLLPTMSLLAYLSAPLFYKMFLSHEMSSNAGGLVRWPAMLMLPLGFSLVFLQGVSEIIKRVAWLTHDYNMDIHYERPLQ